MNERLLVSRNKREGWYVGYSDGHMRSDLRSLSLKLWNRRRK